MMKCTTCGELFDDAANSCPGCGRSRSTEDGQVRNTVDGNDSQRRVVTDGGTASGGTEMAGALISVASILYFLMNLLGVLAFVGLSSLAGGVGAGGTAAAAGIAAVVYLVLTVGFIIAPIGVLTDADWAWTAMAGVWGLNLLWSLYQTVTGGLDALGMIFILINVAVIGWIWTNKKGRLPIGEDVARPV